MCFWQNCVAGTIVAILGAVALVLLECFRQWTGTCRFTLDFKPKKGEGTGYLARVSTSDDGQACYLRVSVNVHSWFGTIAKGCRATLLKIEEQTESGKFKIVHEDPLPLPWCYLGPDPRDLMPRVAFFFDFVSLHSGDNRLCPEGQPGCKFWEDVFSNTGIYRFTVGVSGENAKFKPLRIWVDWKGQCDTVRAGVEGRYIDLSFLESDDSILLRD